MMISNSAPPDEPTMIQRFDGTVTLTAGVDEKRSLVVVCSSLVVVVICDSLALVDGGVVVIGADADVVVVGVVMTIVVEVDVAGIVVNWFAYVDVQLASHGCVAAIQPKHKQRDRGQLPDRSSP